MIDNYEMFTRKAINSIEIAIEAASALGHTYVGSEHIILGFLKEGGNVAAEILKKNNVNVTIRREFGGKISAACGQLRSKKEEV